MFGFGKQKVKNNKKGATPDTVDSRLATQIHVMPSRFYVAPKKNHSGPIIIGVLGFLVIAGLSVAAYYLNENLVNSRVSNVDLPPENNSNINENVNLNANTNVATTTEIVTPTTTPTSTETTNTNVNTNTNTDGNLGSQPLPSSPDNDSDSLTLPEENLYNTDPNNPDTDGDGYQDGAEVLSGYDPTSQGRSLANSELVKFYNHPLYSIYYPARWSVSEQDDQKNEVLFRSSTGEFVEVLVVAVPNNMTLVDWYKTQVPAQDAASATVVTVNGLSGLRTSNLQTYYLSKPNDTSKIFILTYNTGNFQQTNFATTFAAMIKNFYLK